MDIKHTLHIRNLDDETYTTLWNLRKAYGARSWADLIKKIVAEYVERIKLEEWI